MKTLARDRDKAEILERLRALQPTSTGRWGRMSAHQMVCHVSDCCRMLTGQRTVAEAPSRLLPRAIVRWIALYLPLRWPPGIHTSPELDQYGGGTRAVEFAADVAELAALLDVITTGPRRSLDGQRHPVFGRMSEAEWLRWAYLHADHHFRQFGV
jgi:hypothetical protein